MEPQLSEPRELPAAGTLDHPDAVARALLRGLMRDTGLSLAEVARAAELPLLVLAEWMTGRTQPTLGALIRVVQACGLRLRLQLDSDTRYAIGDAATLLMPAREGRTRRAVVAARDAAGV